MSFQLPSLMMDNVLSTITNPALVYAWTNTNAISTAHARRMIDDRPGNGGVYSTTDTPSGVRFAPAAAPSPDANRCVIPRGHSFDGLDVEIYHDSTDSFGTATLAGSVSPSGSDVLDISLSSGNERYWLLRTVGTGTQSLVVPSVFIGERRTLSSAVAIATDFADDARERLVEQEVAGGIASLQLAPAIRRFTLDVRNVEAGTTDETTLDTLRSQGRGTPFWYWPPDTDAGGPYFCRLEGDARKVQDFAAPQVSVRYRYEFTILESYL